jgi:hypothetical protein
VGVSLNKSKGQDGKKPIGEVDNVRYGPEWLQGLVGVSLNKSKGQDGKKPIGEVDNVRISCDGEVIDSAEAQIL